jgi:hypothetical protein
MDKIEKDKIVDLTFSKDEPYILTKLPLSLYSQFIQERNKEQNEIKIRGSWTKEEDDKLIEIIECQGPKRWSVIASKLGCRNGKVNFLIKKKQCRERYLNHLDPKINKEHWTEEEDRIIVTKHKMYGNQWSKICDKLKGRTPNSIKNRWNSTLSKRTEKEKVEKDIEIKEVTEVKKTGEINNNLSISIKKEGLSIVVSPKMKLFNFDSPKLTDSPKVKMLDSPSFKYIFFDSPKSQKEDETSTEDIGNKEKSKGFNEMVREKFISEIKTYNYKNDFLKNDTNFENFYENTKSSCAINLESLEDLNENLFYK